MARKRFSKRSRSRNAPLPCISPKISTAAQKQHFLRWLRLHTLLKTGSKMKTKKGESMLSSGEEVPQKENYISYAITCISFLNGTFLGLLCFALGFSLGGMDQNDWGRFLFSIANYHEISLGDNHHRRHLPPHPPAHAHDHQLRHRHEGGASLVTLIGDAHVHSPTMSPEKPQSPRPPRPSPPA